MRRLTSHLAVVIVLLASSLDWHIAGVVLAGQPQQTQHTLLAVNVRTTDVRRGSASTRDPLPTPVAIDPNATPLPTPYPTPVAVDPDATPLAAPTEQIAASPSVRVQSPALIWPVSGYVSTPYSAAHRAVDIAAPAGTPVVAPFAGTVTWASSKDNGGGLVVEIDHGGLTSLNHLSAISVVVGQYVAQGQIVGAVGMTGNATGNHVHWAEWDGGWRNPLA